MSDITVRENITLVTLHNSPADVGIISGFLSKVSEKGINVDMISLSPPQGSLSDVSFTIADDDLGGILELLPLLREQVSGLTTVVSSGNRKISVYDEAMRETPGMAAEILYASSEAGADIRIITTSETEVSLLVTAATADNLIQKLR